MKKLMSGVAVTLLALGTAVTGTSMALASGGSGSGHSGGGSGGDEARVINKVETEIEDGALQVHERREVRSLDGSRIRVDTTHKIEDGIPVTEVRQRTRDAFGNQTDTRTTIPAVLASTLGISRVLAADEPRLEVKVEKNVQNADGVETKVEIEKKVEGLDAGMLAKIEAMIHDLLAHMHMTM